MRILVFSDSHRKNEGMHAVTRRIKPDRVFHLGDHAEDARGLCAKFPSLEIDFINGNGSFDPAVPYSLVITVEGKKLFLCHGHAYGVKSGLERLIAAARKVDAHAVLFGHTHQFLCERREGLYIFNPGSAGRPYEGPPSCALLEITADVTVFGQVLI